MIRRRSGLLSLLRQRAAARAARARPDPEDDPAARYHVYVIRLDRAVAQHRRFLDANPRWDPRKPCVYVGMSACPPEERLRQHLEGYKASRYAHRYGRELIPRLYERFNPMTYRAAQLMEVELARRLRRRGYGVWQH
ncbi:MAG TPA: hypothetical protein VMS93_10905 [Candidatus Saccharimonadales bacterium]|nr:hypothetical protein [Candidatus Saccharimonadales bacterium]